MNNQPPATDFEIQNPQCKITVVLDNVRSLYNVGSIMRVCDGAGVHRVIACGITPYPRQGRADPRRGPVADRADRELRKTALAAAETVQVEVHGTVDEAVESLRGEGATIVAVESTGDAALLWEAPLLAAPRLALVFGHEVEGVTSSILNQVDAVVKIPMLGAGTSLNVATAAAVVLYEVIRRRLAAEVA